MGVLRTASTFAAAAVAFIGYAAYRRRHGATTPNGLARTPEPLQRWEGEGGAVPAVKRRSTATERQSGTAHEPATSTDEAAAGR
jgi:hypothetical protein